jgi:hypothetical protein
MSIEQKVFLIALAIVASTLTIIISCHQYSDMWHASQGYEWQPFKRGAWLKR